jgi:hypothetical protein
MVLSEIGFALITALSDLVIYIDTAKTLEEQGFMPFQVYFMKMESAVSLFHPSRR